VALTLELSSLWYGSCDLATASFQLMPFLRFYRQLCAEERSTWKRAFAAS
jgi:hypothetical protein